MKNLDEIRRAIVASGSITAYDVDDIREIVYHDGKVERDEAEFLFAIKKELNDLGNLRAWNDFFVQAMCDYVLGGDHSKPEISAVDAQWLVEKIGEDNIIDEVEQRLLKQLRKEAKNFPLCLQELLNHTSILHRICRWLLLHLCRNTRTMRSLELGVGKTGQRKVSAGQIISNLKHS